MNDILLALNDLMVIVFDLLIYTKMFVLKKNTAKNRIIMYAGCVVIVAAYYCAVYVWRFPAVMSSALCMAVPSFLLFFALSKYQDSRFVLTFCFVDTTSLIVAFIGRAIGLFFDNGELCAVVVMAAVFLTLTIGGNKYFKYYHRLLEETKAGWREMASATVLIYFAMVFFASYPKPMIERLEYFPVWFVFACVVISCYVVFIHSIIKTKQIVEQNKRLEREREVYQMAFTDALTGLYNRASYMEKVNQLERQREKGDNVCCIVADVNRFKEINDTNGHHVGDIVLKKIAEALNKAFWQEAQYIFRMGGDEFLILAENVTAEEIRGKINTLSELLEKLGHEMGMEVSVATGYEILMKGDEGTIEDAYIRADRKMYGDKKRIVSKICPYS